MTNSSLVCGIRFGLAALVTTLLCGCAEYRIGSSLPPGVKSVYVPTFENKAGEPQLENDATKAAIAEFQKDGSLKVSSIYSQADSIVTVTLTRFNLQPLRYDPNNPKSANEYRIQITAQIVFEQTEPSKVLAKREVVGETTFEFSGDLTSAKTTAIPKACTDLAHKIVETVVEVW